MITAQYKKDGFYYRLRKHSNKVEVKSGYSDVWMLSRQYQTEEELIKAGAIKLELPRKLKID